MRSVVASAMAVLLSTSVLACNIGRQSNVKLDPKDRAMLTSLGKAINSQELLKGTPVATLFSDPSVVLTLNSFDTKTLSQAGLTQGHGLSRRRGHDGENLRR
jgi:hypothetical protein